MPRSLAILILSLLLGGCANIGYYAQAINGHLHVITAARPIADIVQDASTEPALRRKLEQVVAVRAFASRELGLPDNRSYLSYADLGRPYVVWNVFAAPEFSVEPEKWCLLFVGCINYRGYFAKDDAERYADELRRTGVEVYVAGITAYSTLGHFADPVLNTFLRLGEQETARLIFHELAHQLIYADGDSAFNESFATAVEIEGMRRWLRKTADRDQMREFEARLERQAQFHRLVADARARLAAIYASSLAPAAKRSAKAAQFAAMKTAYADLKARWGGYSAYDKWFERPLNNAQLASVTLYTRWVSAFDALLQQQAGDLAGFYRRVDELASLPKDERAAALTLLLPDPARP